jgi:hypothetical protein
MMLYKPYIYTTVHNSRGGYGAARINSKGYHGDEKPDPRLERELFQKEGHQQTGINFAKVSS